MNPEKFHASAGTKTQERKEVEEGLREYKEISAESVEEDDFLWEEAIREIDPVESKEHLELGLGKAREIIAEMKGDFIGAKYYSDPTGWGDRSEIKTLIDVGEDEILKKLAVDNRDWSALYDDDLVQAGSSTLNGSRYQYYLGDKEIGDADSRDIGSYIDGKEVTHEDFKAFTEEVRKMLHENYQQRGVRETRERELPSEIQDKIKKIKFDYITEQALERGQVVPAGIIKLKHGPYGGSHFGSGGGYGSVKAFDLLEWRNGKRVEKEINTENGDNGFISGPVEITIEPNTIAICKGGDGIGKGRGWGEIYMCE